LVRANKRSREKEDSNFEGKPERKKVKLADGQQAQDGRKRSKEDRLEEFTRIMSKKRVKKASWGADVEADAEDSNFTNKPKEESEANDQNSSRANGADSDGPSTQGDAKETISDAEWMRRRTGGGNLDQRAFEQSDDEDVLTRPETIQVYLHYVFQYHYPILNPCQAQPAEINERFSTHETIRSTSRLFVRNLVFSCTEDELRRHFEEYGPVDQVRAQYLCQGQARAVAPDDKQYRDNRLFTRVLIHTGKR
jgi:multiple RNA-binding domain-containing protein 1